MSPNIQSAMVQAMQALMSGGPLPPNCFVITIPIQQAHQMFPQLMLNYASGGSGGGAMMYPQQYGQIYQPQVSPYQAIQAPYQAIQAPYQAIQAPYQTAQAPHQAIQVPYQGIQAPYQAIQAPSNAPVPYSNYYPQGYNHPVVPYNDFNNKSKKKSRYGRRDPSQPHNVYNSSSFDTHMDNLSWSRLFGHHHSTRKNQAALSYEQKPGASKKRQEHTANTLTSTTSSSTTSDETIRRVNVLTKPPTGSSVSSKQQPKSSLPFKYSSEFIPGTNKQQFPKSNKKDSKIKSDDVFVVKKTEQSQSSSHQ
jgi:hypothetical protein